MVEELGDWKENPLAQMAWFAGTVVPVVPGACTTVHAMLLTEHDGATPATALLTAVEADSESSRAPPLHPHSVANTSVQ